MTSTGLLQRLNPLRRRERRQVEVEFRTHQDRLRDLASDMVAGYQASLRQEVNSPERLAAVYGVEFASTGFRMQARTVAEMASSMLKVPYAMVTIITADEQINVASTDTSMAPAIACEDGYCENVIATGREFSVDNAPEHHLVADSELAKSGVVTSYLGVPIVVDTQIVGVVCAYDTQPRHWGVADVSILARLAAVMTRAAAAAAN